MSEDLTAVEAASPVKDSSDDDKCPRTRAALNGVSPVRLVLGALGLGGFVLGAVTAWHTASATTLLIVSGVLLVLSALGLDWNKIRGTYGGWTVELLRGLETRIEQVAATAAVEDVPPAFRAELETLRAEVKALSPPPARPRRSAPLSNADIEALAKDVMATKATHAFRGTDAVILSLGIAHTAERFRCTVTTPTGAVFTAATRRAINITAISFVGGPKSYNVTYPDEFPGSEPLVPGEYRVEWRADTLDPSASPSSSSASPLLYALFAQSGAPAAIDAFTIPHPSPSAEQEGSHSSSNA
jgi:hypothetical protein